MTLPPLATPEFYSAIVGAAPADGLLDAVSAMVRRYCDWHISPNLTETVTVDGTGGQYLFVKSAHLTNVYTVRNGGIPIDIESVEWSQSGMLKTSGCWTDKMRGVVLEIEHGWASGEIADIAIQTVLIASRIASSPRGEISSTVGGISVQFSSAGVIGASLTEYESAQLAPYCVVGR